jgi:hypothetical protein
VSGESNTCTTLAECRAHEGERVEVVGVYTVIDVSPGRKRNSDPRAVRLMLDTEPGPFLEPYWSPGAARSPQEIARYQGKVVRVLGTFLGEQPPNPDPRAASLGGPCLEEIEEIRLAE